tara:strand:+ start:371 stop:622 length:252 start_codon:yes stop_codon:yes gene_type:complete
MAIFAYASTPNEDHWRPQEDVISLGYCTPNDKHYFFVADDVTLGDQPTTITMAEVTDEDELALMVEHCPMFWGNEDLQTTVGL